jgi:hypothetical protein
MLRSRIIECTVFVISMLKWHRSTNFWTVNVLGCLLSAISINSPYFGKACVTFSVFGLFVWVKKLTDFIKNCHMYNCSNFNRNFVGSGGALLFWTSILLFSGFPSVEFNNLLFYPLSITTIIGMIIMFLSRIPSRKN